MAARHEKEGYMQLNIIKLVLLCCEEEYPTREAGWSEEAYFRRYGRKLVFQTPDFVK